MKAKFLRFFAKNAAFVALFAFLCVLVIGERAFPQIEEKTDAYFSETITNAAMVFATARVINGGISVIKESTVTVTPLGVGTEIALGQILDPVDDVIERLSDILFTVVVSLGIQKTIYEIIGATAVYAVAALLSGSLLITVLSRNKKLRGWSAFLKKAALLLLFIRVALPSTALLSDVIETRFFALKISECKAQLEVFEAETQIQFSETDGFWEKTEKVKKLVQEKVRIYCDNALNIVAVSLEIAGLYIALFLVQVILLPLATFYLIVKITNRFFATNVPVVLSVSPGNMPTEAKTDSDEANKA